MWLWKKINVSFFITLNLYLRNLTVRYVFLILCIPKTMLLLCTTSIRLPQLIQSPSRLLVSSSSQVLTKIWVFYVPR